MTRYENYKESVRFMQEAFDAMDQAQSCIRFARVDPQAGGYRKPSIRELVIDTESLLNDLKATTCEDCELVLEQCKCEWLASEAK